MLEGVFLILQTHGMLNTDCKNLRRQIEHLAFFDLRRYMCSPCQVATTNDSSSRTSRNELHIPPLVCRYEADFFNNVVTGRGILSWGAIDQGRGGAEADQLIGFVTAKIVSFADPEVQVRTLE